MCKWIEASFKCFAHAYMVPGGFCLHGNSLIQTNDRINSFNIGKLELNLYLPSVQMCTIILKYYLLHPEEFVIPVVI